MSEILSAPAILLIWLIGFALAMGLTGSGVWCFVVRQGRVANRTWAAWSAASLLPACLAFWDVFHRLDPGFVGSFVLVLETLLLAGVAIAFYVLGSRQQSSERNSRKASGPAVGRRLSWALLALNAVAGAWASHRLYECTALGDEAYLASLADWLPEPTRAAHAVTDRGGSINLYTAVSNPAAIVPNRDALAAAEARHFLDRRLAAGDRRLCGNWRGHHFTSHNGTIELVERSN